MIRDIVKAIREFEEANKNPHGPNEANPDHCPVMLELRYGGPPERIKGHSWPVDPAEEFPLRPEDRDEQTKRLLKGAGLLTKHKVLYPMTKAYIKQQWHRVYQYDTASKTITDVRLLVSERQDPGYFQNFKSAHGWTIALQKETEPVYELITAPEIEERFGKNPDLA